MEVLDLLFNFRFNTRLEQFVYEFKKTHQQATTSSIDMPEIGEFSNSLIRYGTRLSDLGVAFPMYFVTM